MTIRVFDVRIIDVLLYIKYEIVIQNVCFMYSHYHQLTHFVVTWQTDAVIIKAKTKMTRVFLLINYDQQQYLFLGAKLRHKKPMTKSDDKKHAVL